MKSQNKFWTVQCSAETFEHAAYLSAVFSEVISVNDQAHRLQIGSLPELLKGQFEKLGAAISKSQPCLA
ncbi:MAG TPA: hypothetical protein VEF76_01850 [Patescibacteria group bacterium]|nr:hypothetical protein [Patescibacteria group bacterium]